MDNNHNMSGQENEKREGQDYSLYTEKIVKKPGNRIKRAVKHVAKVIGSAVIFGVVSGLVMSVVYPTARKFVGDEEPTSRQGTVIPTDSQTEEMTDDIYSDMESDTSELESSADIGTEDTAENDNGSETADENVTGLSDGDMNSESTSQDIEAENISREELLSLVDEQISSAFDEYRPGVTELDSLYTGLKSVIETVDMSLVSIEVSQDGVTWDYVSDAGIMGFIAAEDEEYFYILTTKQFVSDKYLSVIFNDGTIAQGTYITGDTTTNIAIVAVEKAVYNGEIPENVKVAVLGNSYVIQQGDPVIAVGSMYGQSGMVVYTTATSINESFMDTDGSYRVISTAIEADEADCGIIVNTKGEVVGIIPYQNEAISGKIINSYGISELKRLIERLINGKVTPYAGISPQTVTAVMKEVYGMPDGVYVNSVEDDSPAFYAGIQSGDIITAIDSENIQTVRAFQNVLFSTEPGMTVTVYISRPGKDGYRNVEIPLEVGVE